MNIKKIVMVGAAVAMAGAAVAAGTVSGVKARQRYPWNGLVDIDCTVTGTAGTTYSLTVNARDKVGGTNLTVKTVSVEGESASGNPVSVTSGVYRLVWNADTDLPNGFRGEKVSISVTVTDSAKKFMIVDLSTGAITYQATAPEGGWTDTPYKLTKMAFQRIEPATFDQVISGQYTRKVTITKPFYLSVLPVTKGHYEALGVWSSFGITYDYQTGYVANSTDAPAFVNCAYNNNFNYMRLVRGSDGWPTGGHTVGASSPLAVIRTRTGISKFDLPTEAQISLAFKSMTIADIGRGCLDRHVADLGNGYVIDPVGPLKGTATHDYANFTVVNVDGSHLTSAGQVGIGVRFCLYEAE